MTAEEVTEKPKEHPAKFAPVVLDAIRVVLFDRFYRHGQFRHRDHESARPNVLDPFGGIGGLHDLSWSMDNVTPTYNTHVIELEPEWADQARMRGYAWTGNWFKFNREHDTFHWDHHLFPGKPLTHATWLTYRLNAIVTSPTYGNRMADHHEAKDTSTRITYRHKLGRPLSWGNSGEMAWGSKYRAFHLKAWLRAYKMLDDGGLMVVNVKDHIRKGQLQQVPEWHRDALEDVGFKQITSVMVPVTGMGFGQNREVRVDHEWVLVYEK